jgi:hypothetical protein
MIVPIEEEEEEDEVGEEVEEEVGEEVEEALAVIGELLILLVDTDDGSDNEEDLFSCLVVGKVLRLISSKTVTASMGIDDNDEDDKECLIVFVVADVEEEM